MKKMGMFNIINRKENQKAKEEKNVAIFAKSKYHYYTGRYTSKKKALEEGFRLKRSGKTDHFKIIFYNGMFNLYATRR